MRKITALSCLLALLFASSAVANAASSQRTGLFRHPSLGEAWRASRRSQRPILLYATTDDCYFCEKMLGGTFREPRVSRLVASSFEPVMVKTTSEAELVRKLGIERFPTTIIALPDGRIVDRIEGYVEPATLRRQLAN